MPAAGRRSGLASSARSGSTCGPRSCARRCAAPPEDEPDPEVGSRTMVEVELVDADVDREVGVPRMILRELGGAGRQLTIFIGGVEMHAIQLAVEGHEPPRP